MRHEDRNLKLIIDLTAQAKKIIEGSAEVLPEDSYKDAVVTQFIGDLKALMLHRGFNYAEVSKHAEGLRISLHSWHIIENP